MLPPKEQKARLAVAALMKRGNTEINEAMVFPFYCTKPYLIC